MTFNLSIHYIGDQFGSNEERCLEITYDQAVELLKHQQALRENLDSLARLSSPDDGTNYAVRDALSKARTNSSQISSHLDRLWNLIPAAKQTSNRTAAIAEQVFSTPELLEAIISHLDLDGQLTAMQVQRKWYDTILGSVKLRRGLGLASYEDGKYYSVFSRRTWGRPFDPLLTQCVPGGTFDDEDPKYFRWDEDSKYSFWTINHQPLQEDPTALIVTIVMKKNLENVFVGSRTESVLIMDPPAKQIGAIIDCGPCYKGEEAKRFAKWKYYFTPQHGFPVGELLAYSRYIYEDHAKCDHGHIRYVRNIELQEDDIVMQQRREKRSKPKLCVRIAGFATSDGSRRQKQRSYGREGRELAAMAFRLETF